MRTARLIILVLLLAGAASAYWWYRKSTESPFAFGLARPGRSYKSVEKELRESAQVQMTCTQIDGGYRICRGSVDDPKGELTLVVNERGHVVIVDERVGELTEATKTLTAQLTEQWNEESAGTTLKRPGVSDATRWVSEDNNWSATMTPRRGSTSVGEVVLVDERTLAAMDARTLPALLVLSREGIVGASALDAAEHRAPGALAKAADRLAAAGRPLGDAAARLPECGPQAALGIDAGQARHVALGGPAAELLTQALARIYPDRRLELRDSVYLVDGDGVPELIEVTDPVRIRNGAAYAFGISYAGRATAVALSTQAFETPTCRAPAEIVIATLDRSRTRITNVERFPADEEGFASRVMELRAVPEGGYTRLVVHTLTTYGSGDWYGEVDWLGTVNVDSLRVEGQRPTTLAKMDTQSRVAAVDLTPYVPMPALAAQSLGGKRVIAIVQTHGGSTPQPIVLPSAKDGRPSGWTMLTVL